MHPVLFGRAESPLYGVHHPPRAAGAGPRGVLLCNPYGQEATRGHRPFRVLADRFARAGVGALRFDYSCTGDSAGACEDGHPSVWIRDILDAHAHLLRLAGGGPIVWVGLRLGGSLAYQAAALAPAYLSGLVLWEPILDGEAYLTELRESDVAYMREALDDPTYGPAEDRAVPSEAFGFAIGARFADEIRTLIRFPVATRPTCGVAVVSADEGRARAAFAPGGVTWRLDADTGNWNSQHAMNAFVVPQAAIGAVLDCAMRLA